MLLCRILCQLWNIFINLKFKCILSVFHVFWREVKFQTAATSVFDKSGHKIKSLWLFPSWWYFWPHKFKRFSQIYAFHRLAVTWKLLNLLFAICIQSFVICEAQKCFFLPHLLTFDYLITGAWNKSQINDVESIEMFALKHLVFLSPSATN